MTQRSSWDDYFVALARSAAKRSTCPRLSVGCVIVDTQHNVLSTGYNGSKPGDDHCIDVGCRLVNNRCKRTIHAEDNAIRRAPSRRELSGSTLYCTHIPCDNCARLILAKGIIEAVYEEPYKDYATKMKPLFDFHGVVLRQHVVANED